MKKYIISMMAVATVAIAGWNYQQNKEVELSDLAMANVEALASGEGSGNCKWRTGWSSSGGWIAICDTYGVGYVCECGSYKQY